MSYSKIVLKHIDLNKKKIVKSYAFFIEMTANYLHYHEDCDIQYLEEEEVQELVKEPDYTSIYVLKDSISAVDMTGEQEESKWCISVMASKVCIHLWYEDKKEAQQILNNITNGLFNKE